VQLRGVKRAVLAFSGFPAAARRPAELGAIGSPALAEQQVGRFPLDQLTGLEAEGLCARAPPAAGRLTPGLAGLEVIPGPLLDQASVDLRPDVIQVITLAQGRNNCQALLRGPEAAELTMIIRWCVRVTHLRIMNQ
jgi:hypothetical protein